MKTDCHSDSMSRSEAFSAWLLRGPLAAGVLGLCLVQLALWVPHFVTWPWFSDHDVFGTLAFSWESGRLPYRECVSNNFPGTIYLFWALGKSFGWGRTAPVLAADAALVVFLGAGWLAWSRRRFGALLPGAVGYAAFLSYYLGLDHFQVVQRDWHASLAMVAGLMAVESLPLGLGVGAAALATASAISLRPQSAAFLPALVLALVQASRRPGAAHSRGRTLGVLTVWAILAAVLTALAFVPLVAAGVWDDFVRGVRLTAYGSSYNLARPRRVVEQFVLQALHARYLLVPVCLLAVRGAVGARTRESIGVWLLATLGVWFYKPLSPVPWPYLSHPLVLVAAVNASLLVQAALEARGAGASLRLCAVLTAMLAAGIELRPEYCQARASFEALRRRGVPAEAPPGYHERSPDLDQQPCRWDEYQGVLEYLRTQTGPRTTVANLLRVPPALTGPAARLSALPAESLAWLIVDPSAEPAFRAALEAAGDSVVVWIPDEALLADRYRLAPAVRHLAEVVRTHYKPRARFGRIEVWHRKS